MSLDSLVPLKVFPTAFSAWTPHIAARVPPCQCMGFKYPDSLCAPAHQRQVTCTPKSCFLIPGDCGPALTRATQHTSSLSKGLQPFPSPMRSKPILGKQPSSKFVLLGVLSLIPGASFRVPLCLCLSWFNYSTKLSLVAQIVRSPPAIQETLG